MTKNIENSNKLKTYTTQKIINRKKAEHFTSDYPELLSIERFFFTGEMDEQTKRYAEREERKERVLEKYKLEWELD